MAVETGDPDILNGDIGSVSNPHVWAQVTTEPGTSAEANRIFVERVLDTYNVNENQEHHRTLIHDNLTSHRALEVYEALSERGHCVICRPPHRPQDGPVGYAINQVCLNLTIRWNEVHDLETMQAIIEEIIKNDITGMDETFLHCGYIWN